jgi:hypothetical protein
MESKCCAGIKPVKFSERQPPAMRLASAPIDSVAYARQRDVGTKRLGLLDIWAPDPSRAVGPDKTGQPVSNPQ